MAGAFRIKGKEMLCEGLSLMKILEEIEKKYKNTLTPLFIYSKKKLHENVKAYMDALKESGCWFQLNFSIKANQNLTLLKEFQLLGTSATLVSGNELKLALEAGFEPTKLMLNGGGKYKWETRLAIENGVLVNVDSEWDLRQTLNICRHGFQEPMRARVLLRMNLNIDPQVHAYVNTGKVDCKFGLSEESAEHCIQLLEEPDCLVDLVGLHSHIGSTIYQTSVFRVCVEKLLIMRQQLQERGFTNVNILNLGGGLGINYLEHEPETRPWRREAESNKKNLVALLYMLLQKVGDCGKSNIIANPASQSSMSGESDVRENCAELQQVIAAIHGYKGERTSFHELTEAVNRMLTLHPEIQQDIDKVCPFLTKKTPSHSSPEDLVQSVSDLLKGTPITLILEPGRSLVANSCILLARVLGCKETINGRKYIITDASMTEVIRPCLYSSYHHISTIPANSDPAQHASVKHVYDIVGPVCESADFLGQDRLLPDPDPENGFIMIHDVGAYCQSMSSNYNIRMRAAEVLVDGDTWRLIRRPDTFEDFLQPYKNLK